MSNLEKKPSWSIEFVAFLVADDPATGPWKPCPPGQVPASFKNPDVLSRMLDTGEDAMDAKGDQRWYRAVKLEQPAAANNPEQPQ